MKSYFLLIIWVIISIDIYSQNNNRSINNVDNPNSDETEELVVAEDGLYLSFGIGSGSIGVAVDLATHFSCSFAKNSYLFTFTRMSSLFSGEIRPNKNIEYSADYYGLLVGRGIRKKHLLLSASVGLALSDIGYKITNYYGVTETHDKKGLSIPFESKLFLLAGNGIGLGFHYSLDAARTYCPSTFTFSIVIGIWNKKENKYSDYFSE